MPERPLDRLAARLRRAPVPDSGVRARLVLSGHVLARALSDRARPGRLRRALVQVGFLEAALRTFGRWGMLSRGERFFPLVLLPDFHGPHFDEALRRLLLPGRGPFVAHVAVTGACPCSCSYCYASAGGAEPPDLGDERLFEVARSVARLRIPMVVLSGGEPLARYRRLLRMVHLLRATSEVRLATSGVGLTAQRAAELREAGLRVLAVSLDSDDPDTVNAARGYRRAFDSAVQALRCSAAAGIQTYVTAVVGRSTFEAEGAVGRFLSFVRDIHPTLLVNFLPGFATGRASAAGFRTPEEYAVVAQRIHHAIRDGGYRATVFLQPLEHLMGCVGGGRRQMNVDIAGNVTACISAAGFGNVADEPLEALIARFSTADARLKRGFFCASVADRAPEGGVLTPAESLRALSEFYATQPDTLFQRLLDVAGPPIQWLARP